MKIHRLFLSVIALQLASCGPVGPYDDVANPSADITAAIAQAAAEQKLVLLEFGANWLTPGVCRIRRFSRFSRAPCG
ncbi:MAG: hypothetical protein E2O52_01465 [Gammaproteobacteria bacterium]|nr:MAG: hypothetical protein E2O52_01465 [Gammaproteobacteria bacterium]